MPAPPSHPLPTAGLALLLALAVVTAWTLAAARKAGQSEGLRHTANLARLAADLPGPRSQGDYVTSAECRACHPGEHASWHRTFHRTMTQAAAPENVLGAFDGTAVSSDGLLYRVIRDGDAFWAEMPDPDVMMYVVQGGRDIPMEEIPRVRLPVVMTTGSHHYQTYWVASERYDRLLQTLPLVWLIADQRWIPREEAFLRGPGDRGRFITQWNHHCIRCHSTGGNPGLDLESGQLRTEVGELGIACEACHGPGEAHVRRHRDPIERYRALLSDQPDPTIVNPARLDHRRSSQVCGQCHAVSILQDEVAMEYARRGPLFRPGDDLEATRYLIQHPRVDPTPERRQEWRENPQFFRERWWDDGTILAGGREFTGMSASACYRRGTMSCLSCHSMHASDPVDQLIPGMDTSHACTQCHTEPRFTTEVQRHTFHAPASTGSDCLNCHMPHTTYALLKGIRSHQIESPHARASARLGVPNACNLCHLDRTLAWTAEHLERWYGQPRVPLTDEQRSTSAALLWLLKGHAAQRVIASWHLGWEPALAASGRDWLAPFQAELLADSYGVVRYVAERELRKLPGFESTRYDFLNPANDVRTDIRALQDTWQRLTPNPTRTGPEILLHPDGALMWDRLAALLEAQDQRPVTVKE
ncbi:MAG: hypothetical protein KF833_20930 [Verrucomicrobiae bacterium]|nr:hypothetical protein [Verrucomicrobiae bacterium]